MVETLTVLVPDPAFREDVRLPYPAVGPYSTYQDVDAPLGLTVPAILADVALTDDAGPVTTIGTERVLNVASAPVRVPPSFVAVTR